jgi:hypothetical protein
MYCTLHCTFSVLSPSLVRMKVRDSDVLNLILMRRPTKGIKDDESSTGRVWAAGFHHVTARSRLERVLKLMNYLFDFPFFFEPR